MKSKILTAVVLMLGLFLGMASAHALPTPKDVEALVKAGELDKAEAMTAEILKVAPDKAKVHYYYAQIAERQANASSNASVKAERMKRALEALKRAKELDPSLSFANASKFSAQEKRLLAATAPPTAISALPESRVPAASVATKASDTSSALSTVFLWVLGLTAAFVVLFVGSSLWSIRKDKIRAKAKALEDDAVAKEKHLKLLLSLKEKVAANKLEWEFSPGGLTDVAASNFAQGAQRIQNALEQVTRADSGWAKMDYTQMEREVLHSCGTPQEQKARFEELEKRMAREDARREAEIRRKAQEAKQQKERPTSSHSSRKSSAPQVVTKASPPEPVREVHHYHENPSSGGGLGDVLVGAALMSMLSNNSHSEERVSKPSSSRTSEPEPDFDTGGNSSSWDTPAPSGGGDDSWDS